MTANQRLWIIKRGGQNSNGLSLLIRGKDSLSYCVAYPHEKIAQHTLTTRPR